MFTGVMIQRIGYGISLLAFIFGTILFYNDSHSFWYSLFAAFLSSLLVFISFIMISWFAQVFTK